MNGLSFSLKIFGAGLLFGAGLAISGMTDPQRVVAFLDIFGDWDPTLMFVMGGALAVFGIGRLILRRAGVGKIPASESEPISKKLVIGALLFGIGWGLGGFCPGPAIANLSDFRTEALVFVPLMAVGMFFAQRFCGVD